MNPCARILIGCLLLLVISEACSKPPQNSDSQPAGTANISPSPRSIKSELVVRAAAEPAAIVAGGSTDAIVRLTIQSGYHINANPPTFPYLIATQLDVPSGDGISISTVSYPRPVARKFAFADKPLAVYEGEAELKATLKADRAAGKGERSLAAQLRVQACDEVVCYPPGKIELRIPVTVK
jgi:hypothetical protein